MTSDISSTKDSYSTKLIEINSLPRILIVDDQFASDPFERELFLKATGLMDAANPFPPHNNEAIAVAQFCGGQRFQSTSVVNDYEIVQEAVDGQEWSLILIDAQFDSGSLNSRGKPKGALGDDQFGEFIRMSLAHDFPNIPLVMLSGKSQHEIANQSVSYLSKNRISQREIRRSLLVYGALTKAQIRLVLQLPDYIVAESDKTIEVFREAFLFADDPSVSILLLGASGTGKEEVARYIHQRSPQSTGPFEAVNLAAIPKELVESELFGSEKGAYTGATATRIGYFERANDGTLFLDEIGDMPVDAQVKLLRVLQERSIVRLGGQTTISLNSKVVCATSRDLGEQMRLGTFREDLFHRVSTVTIKLPELNDRREEIPGLARSLLAKAAKDSQKDGLELSPDALSILQKLDYKGNVRELENLLRNIGSRVGHFRVIGRKDVVAAIDPSVIAFDDSLLTQETEDPNRKVESKDAVSAVKIPMRNGGATVQTSANKPSVAQVLDAIHNTRVLDKDPALVGVKERLDDALSALHKKLLGAALERCRDPVSGAINRQKAVQLLTGNTQLKGRLPVRFINEVLGRRRDSILTEEDIESLVRFWQESLNN